MENKDKEKKSRIKVTVRDLKPLKDVKGGYLMRRPR